MSNKCLTVKQMGNGTMVVHIAAPDLRELNPHINKYQLK